jgi:plastocyanin
MEAPVRRAYALPAAVLVLVLLLAGCGGGDDDNDSSSDAAKPSGPTEDLTAKDFSFKPTEFTLQAGKNVTFVVDNQDSAEHNLTIEDLDVSKDVEGGETINQAVTPDAGTYQFHCKYHPDQMKGTITVE